MVMRLMNMGWSQMKARIGCNGVGTSIMFISADAVQCILPPPNSHVKNISRRPRGSTATPFFAAFEYVFAFKIYHQ